MRHAGRALLVGILLAACRPDMTAWRARLADPAVARLGGAWTIEMRADSGSFGHERAPARATGALALVLNRERVTTSLLESPTVAFGTYDIRLDALGITSGDAMGTPDVWVRVRHDSLIVSLSPTAKWPITLAGLWRGDSIVGRWAADQRAGPSGTGEFVLRGR
jgi:hypothetical protein